MLKKSHNSLYCVFLVLIRKSLMNSLGLNTRARMIPDTLSIPAVVIFMKSNNDHNISSKYRGCIYNGECL